MNSFWENELLTCSSRNFQNKTSNTLRFKFRSQNFRFSPPFSCCSCCFFFISTHLQRKGFWTNAFISKLYGLMFQSPSFYWFFLLCSLAVQRSWALFYIILCLATHLPAHHFYWLTLLSCNVCKLIAEKGFIFNKGIMYIVSVP